MAGRGAANRLLHYLHAMTLQWGRREEDSGAGLNIWNERNIEQPVGVPRLLLMSLFISLKTKSNTQMTIPSINQTKSQDIFAVCLFFALHVGNFLTAISQPDWEKKPF